MRKMFLTNVNFNAKATVTLATCIFVALTLTTRADDKDKQENPALQAPAKGGAAELQPSPSTPSVNSSLDKDKAGSSTSTSSSTSSSSTSQGGPGSGASSTSGKLTRADEKFIRDAAKGGMMEVHMGKLGTQKAQSSEVKQFAQRLIDDHTKANNELKQLAAQKGITLPDDKVAGASSDSERTKVRESESSGEHAEHHAAMKKLETLSGTEFDREFVRAAVTDHQKDVKEFERAAQKCDDADVKAFAQKTAPTLREHLQQAKSLQAQVGGSTDDSQK
jgi:putative membrane protein